MSDLTSLALPPLWRGEGDKTRHNALAHARALGLPQPRDEAWKYTNPVPFNNALLALLAQGAQEARTDTLHDWQTYGDAINAVLPMPHIKIVFTDGVFNPALSDSYDGYAGLSLAMLGARATDNNAANTIYGALANRAQAAIPQPMAALNTAFATDGAMLQVSETCSVPIVFIYYSSGRTGTILHHAIDIDTNAKLDVIELFVGKEAAQMSSVVLETRIGAQSKMNHVRLDAHVLRSCDQVAKPIPTYNAVFADIGAEGAFRSYGFTGGAALQRNEAVVNLCAPHACAEIVGATIGTQQSHTDDSVLITHNAPYCTSRQVFRKVLYDAVGVFQGKIHVHPDAQKTDGYQLSQALLLDKNSQFLVKPELEIYADDVVCSHGSTSGGLDADALFYLSSRGLADSTAKRLLIQAFLAETTAEIANADIADAVLSVIERCL